MRCFLKFWSKTLRSLTLFFSYALSFMRGMNLQAHFLLLIGATLAVFLLMIWGVYANVAERVLGRFSARLAEKQVLYDKTRTLQPLIHELALARQLADNAAVRRWAANEHDARAAAAALSEMEKFRHYFQEGSYFMVFAQSGNYYFNDASAQYAGRQLRYTMDRSNAENAWFYATLANTQKYNINVDQNTRLKQTKVWINVLLREGDKVLGVIGTGLDLSKFIHDVADIGQPGITNLFVDRDGAIQIYREQQYIDFSSLAKPADKRRSIDQLFEGNRSDPPLLNYHYLVHRQFR